MRNILAGIFIVFSMIANSSEVTYEGPFLTDTAPDVRLSSSGTVSILGISESVGCLYNKAEALGSENMESNKMILSVGLAAQLSDRNVYVWIERYDTTTPQRCKLRYIQIK